MNFTGTWYVVSSPDFDDDYLRKEVEPYVKLRQVGDRVEGEYHIGRQKGLIEGRLQSENQIRFDYRGTYGIDQGGSVGTATVEGDHLTLTLIHHKGDELTFACKRDRSSTGETPRRF